MSLFVRTFLASAFQHIVDTFHFKSAGQCYCGYSNAFEAEGPVAYFAEEVNVLVIWHAVATVAAYRVFEAAAAIVYLVYQFVRPEQVEIAEYGRLVGTLQRIFQILEAHGLGG